MKKLFLILLILLQYSNIKGTWFNVHLEQHIDEDDQNIHSLDVVFLHSKEAYTLPFGTFPKILNYCFHLHKVKTIKELKTKICNMHPYGIYTEQDIAILKLVHKDILTIDDIPGAILDDSIKIDDLNYDWSFVAININTEKENPQEYLKKLAMQQQQIEDKQKEEQQLTEAADKIVKKFSNNKSNCIIQ